MLRLSLEPAQERDGELLLRKGRAIGWIEEAVEPLREQLGDAELRRLVIAIRSAVGIEALVWLTDVAKLSHDEARELMRWSAQAMLRAAVDPADPVLGPLKHTYGAPGCREGWSAGLAEALDLDALGGEVQVGEQLGHAVAERR